MTRLSVPDYLLLIGRVVQPLFIERGLILVHGFILGKHKRTQSQFSLFQQFKACSGQIERGKRNNNNDFSKNVAAGLMKNVRYLWNMAKDKE